MKIVLTLLLCSYVADTCLPPHVYHEEFDNDYDCLIAGYKESLLKIEEIGSEAINEHRMYIKFGCTEIVYEDNT